MFMTQGSKKGSVPFKSSLEREHCIGKAALPATSLIPPEPQQFHCFTYRFKTHDTWTVIHTLHHCVCLLYSIDPACLQDVHPHNPSNRK